MQGCFLFYSDIVNLKWCQMEIKSLKLKLFRRKKLKLKGFMKKYSLGHDTINQSDKKIL